MTRLSLIFIIASLFLGSSTYAQTEREILNENSESKDDSSFVNGSSGLLFIDTYAKNEWIIKNTDNSVFASFNFTQKESRTYYDQLNAVVSPFELFAYKPDYNLLVFKCNLTSSDYLVTTKKGENKFITRENKNYKFYTWAEFLLSDRYLSIQDTYNDFEDTPVKFHKSPNDSSEFVQFEQPGEFLIKAVEVRNDWIRVKRESLVDDNLKPYFGWTKWKENDKLIIDFWFLL